MIRWGVAAGFAFIMMILIGSGYYLFDQFVNSSRLSGVSSVSNGVLFEVVRGQNIQQISERLENEKLISNAFFFSIYARFTGQAERVKIGEYLLNPYMKPSEILKVISSGRSVGRSFTVAEGLNIYEIAELYEKSGFGISKDFLKLCFDQSLIQELVGQKIHSLEGYLFPETYQITKFSSTRDLIKQMVFNFKNTYSSIVKESQISGMDQHQIVTLASIIEKETGAPEERFRISAVFHNRLKKGMMLQTDPTILYGIADVTGKMPRNITRNDIKTKSRYNTYQMKGLPLGPIANPGREALLAAVQPEESDYLFFVSRNDGTHIFSKSYQDHNKAVKLYQMDPKAREGKSWRDLKKSKPRD